MVLQYSNTYRSTANGVTIFKQVQEHYKWYGYMQALEELCFDVPHLYNRAGKLTYEDSCLVE